MEVEGARHLCAGARRRARCRAWPVVADSRGKNATERKRLTTNDVRSIRVTTLKAVFWPLGRESGGLLGCSVLSSLACWAQGAFIAAPKSLNHNEE
jgi:hypothetical protein